MLRVIGREGKEAWRRESHTEVINLSIENSMKPIIQLTKNRTKIQENKIVLYEGWIDFEMEITITQPRRSNLEIYLFLNLNF